MSFHAASGVAFPLTGILARGQIRYSPTANARTQENANWGKDNDVFSRHIFRSLHSGVR